jgi:hypothetical protein
MPPCSGFRYNRGMPFVIKLTSRTGGMFWLSAANAEGIRMITTRESAGVFRTYEDANTAIRKLPQAFKVIGRIFSVESAAD